MMAAFTVHGRVQGVGYRYYAQDEAQRLGLAGWVRNEFDDTVIGLAEGGDAAMEAFRALLERGPSLSNVTRLDWMMLDSAESLPRPFQIRR
jgi:acylphosphatase